MNKQELENLQKLPFEESLDSLEKIVTKMEQGQLSLDKTIEYFEKGNTLAKICRKKLEGLEKKIEVLVKDDLQDGQWEDFKENNTREVQVKDDDENLDSNDLLF